MIQVEEDLTAAPLLDFIHPEIAAQSFAHPKEAPASAISASAGGQAKFSFSRTTNSRAIEGNYTQSNGYHGQFTATWEEVTDKGHVMKMVQKNHRGETVSATYLKQQPDPVSTTVANGIISTYVHTYHF